MLLVFCIGLLLGGFIGVLIMSLLYSASEED